MSRAVSALLAVGVLALLALVGVAMPLNARAERSFDAAWAARELPAVADGLRAALQPAKASRRGSVSLQTGSTLNPSPPPRPRRCSDPQSSTTLYGTCPRPSALSSGWRPSWPRSWTTWTKWWRPGARAKATTRALIETSRGKGLMDEANVFLLRFVRLGDAQLGAGVDDQRRGLANLRGVNVVVAALIAVTAATVVWIIAASARSLARTRAEVAGLNAGLERRAETRTAALAAARDRAEP